MVRKRVDHHKFMLEVKRKSNLIKSHEKAKMLRKYSKLCAQEGIQSDRVHIGNSEGTSVSQEDDDSSSSKKKRLPKSFPFAKEIKRAEEKKQEELSKQQSREERESAIRLAEKERKRKRKEFQQKNKRGQPLLGNKIRSMLDRLQKGASSK